MTPKEFNAALQEVCDEAIWDEHSHLPEALMRAYAKLYYALEKIAEKEGFDICQVFGPRTLGERRKQV